MGLLKNDGVHLLTLYNCCIKNYRKTAHEVGHGHFMTHLTTGISYNEKSSVNYGHARVYSHLILSCIQRQYSLHLYLSHHILLHDFLLPMAFFFLFNQSFSWDGSSPIHAFLFLCSSSLHFPRFLNTFLAIYNSHSKIISFRRPE